VFGLYFGKINGEYWWALSNGERFYLYKRGKSTKYRAEYQGAVGFAELVRAFGRERVAEAFEKALERAARLVGAAVLIKALPPDAKHTLAQLVERGLAAMPPKAREAAKQLEEVKALTDDDG
jgi:hypothetical protein